MGNNDIAAISKNMSSSALENTVNWCFTTDNIKNASKVGQSVGFSLLEKAGRGFFSNT